MTEEEKKEKTEAEEREDILNSIADSIDGSRDEDMVPVADEEPVEEEVEEEEAEEEPTEEVDEEPADDDSEQLIKVEINGKVEEIPVSEVGRRLQEAESLKRQPEPKKEPTGPSEIEVAEQRFKDARKAYAKAVISVNEDDIEKTQDELFDAQQTLFNLKHKAPDIEEIKRAAVQEVKMDAIFDRLNKPAEEGGQADIMADEYAKMIARAEADKMIRNGASPFDWTVYEKAGREARRILKWNVDDGMEARREKKKKVVDIKQAHQKTPGPKKDDKPQTHDELIKEGMQEILKARGSL